MRDRKDREKYKKILDFFDQAEGLKSAIRYSERKKVVRESVADHSWKLSLMVLVLAEEFGLGINKEKALEIALIHDLAEAITGDIDYLLVAQGRVSLKDKKIFEKKAMKKITSKLSGKAGRRIYSLWQEYERGATKEAQFVRAMDKLEALTHLLKNGYLSFYNDKPELIPNHANGLIVKFPELAGLLKAIKKGLKKEFIKGGIVWRNEYNIKT